MATGAQILVVGSSNVDMVVKAEKIPAGGETVLGSEFVMVPGGKGANQAVCAAKLGAHVRLVARVGDDVFGRMSLDNFLEVGIDTKYIVKDQEVSNGVALISVDRHGENAIVVAPGANARLSPKDVIRARSAIEEADVVIVQLEIPQDTVARTIEIANAVGTRVVLNPAPVRPMEKELISKVDVLVPNQHEAAALLGRDGEGARLDPETAAKDLMDLGVDSVVITLGARGAYAATSGKAEYIEPMKVQAVDTTAAGDAFTASLALSIAEGSDLFFAARFAAKVAAIVTTKMGAQPSMPTREEVESFRFGN